MKQITYFRFFFMISQLFKDINCRLKLIIIGKSEESLHLFLIFILIFIYLVPSSFSGFICPLRSFSLTPVFHQAVCFLIVRRLYILTIISGLMPSPEWIVLLVCNNRAVVHLSAEPSSSGITFARMLYQKLRSHNQSTSIVLQRSGNNFCGPLAVPS